MIKLLIFDFGSVIGCDADDWEVTFNRISVLTGLAHLKLHEIFDKYWQDLKIGKREMRTFWKEVCEKSRLKISIEKLRKVYSEDITVDPKMFAFVKNLAKKYDSVILMNESDDGGHTKIEKFKLNKIFRKVYNSADIRIGKPHKEAFLLVLKEQKVKPEEALFIDNQENNCEAAKALRINSIQFKNLNQLKYDLSNFLSY